MRYKVFFILSSLFFIYGFDNANEINKETDFQYQLLDYENSSKLWNFEELSDMTIPKEINYKGEILSAIFWMDKYSENILINTIFEEDKSKLIARKEIYSYFYNKKYKDSYFNEVWKISDYNDCEFDLITKFLKKSITITDVNNNDKYEISIPYLNICRSGVSPGVMKVIMYENKVKYALRGLNIFNCSEQFKPDWIDGKGDFTPSGNLKNDSILLKLMSNQWDRHKCDS